MNVLRTLALCGTLILTAGGALAQNVQDSIIAQLVQQGFGNIQVSQTLLGRVRITAVSAELRRELVFNPATGEILRDYWEPLGSSTAMPRIFDPGNDDDDSPRTPNSGSGGSGGSIADDDDDDAPRTFPRGGTRNDDDGDSDDDDD